MKIESLNNSKVKNWAKLKEKKYRDETNLFLVEGDHLLNSAMVNGSIVEIISTDETMEIPGIPFYLVTDSIMKKLSSQVSSSKVIGVCKKSEEQENSAILYLNQLLINHLKTRNYGNIQFIFVGTGVPVSRQRDDVSVEGRERRPRQNQIPEGQSDPGNAGLAGEIPGVGEFGKAADAGDPERIRRRGQRHDLERLHAGEPWRGGRGRGSCGDGGLRTAEIGVGNADSTEHDGDAGCRRDAVLGDGIGADGDERILGE